MKLAYTVAVMAMTACAATLREQTRCIGPNEHSALNSYPQFPLSHVESEYKGYYDHWCNDTEGTIRTINGNDYNIYCYNSKFDNWDYLPVANSFEATFPEKRGFHWYPHGATECYIFKSPTPKLYVYNRDQSGGKVAAFPAPQSIDYPLCPLLQEGEVHHIDGERFHYYCKGQVKANPANNDTHYTQTDTTFQQCLQLHRLERAVLFHWYQPSEVAQGYTSGRRDCEIVKRWPSVQALVPLPIKDTGITVIPAPY